MCRGRIPSCRPRWPSSHSSSSHIGSHGSAASTSTSRATWPRRSPSNRPSSCGAAASLPPVPTLTRADAYLEAFVPKSSIVVGRLPEALRRPAPLLFLEPPVARCGRRLRRAALPLDAQARPDRRRESVEGELAVSCAAPFVLRDRPHYRAAAPPQPRLLRFRERLRGVHVEERLDPRFRLLCVLAAGPARARVSEADLLHG